MRRVMGVLLVAGLLGLGGAAYAQEKEKEKEKKEEKQEKSKASKDAKKPAKKAEPAPGPGDSADVTVQERRAITRVARGFADAFESRSPRTARGYLDERFYDFPRFEDQVTRFIQQNVDLRIFLRESSVEVKDDRATMIVDAEMIYTLKSNPAADQKREQRIQFDFVRTDKGWKIYEITPRAFFTP
jgi:hypothetical protein